MITVRRATERHHVQRGEQEKWLTFFPQDGPESLTASFGVLATFNEMHLPPGMSSGPHRRAAAEIVTYVHTGMLAQEDSTGHSGMIRAGEFQRMVIEPRRQYKETNASRTDRVHLFRITLHPPPSVIGPDAVNGQKRFTTAQRRNVLCVVASRDGRNGSLRLHQDAVIYSSILDPGRHLVHDLAPGRSAWLHIVSGEATVEDIILNPGDGVGITLEPSVSLTGQEGAEILLVDLGPLPDSPGGDAAPLRGVKREIEDADLPVALDEPRRRTRRDSRDRAPEPQVER